MHKRVSIVLFVAFLFVGCAGREANPVSLYIQGDEDRNCESLKKEVTQLQEGMLDLLPKTDKLGTNALWATAGAFFIIPYFFVDMKDAEKIEFEAMRRRHNRLLEFLQLKECEVDDIKAKPIPSIEQHKRETEESLKQR